MVLGLQSFTQRIGEGAGQPILDAENDEQLMHVQPGVAIVLGNRAPESPGTLYISTKRILWLSDVDREQGYEVGFLSVSLHAVSRDPEAYSLPCIYTQIETEAGEDEESEDSDSEYHQALDVSKITEMRLVPSDPNQLDSLFDIFCQCAELNPEPEEEEEEHNWIFSADQLPDDADSEGREESEWQLSENPANPIGYSNGDHDLSHRVVELHIGDQRFDDAEEMEHDTRSSHQ
ncbi:chloride conductance regulatory protein ICln [Telopea speciosissima]|uniref:chloride conductance regulatory protein ICln n=1 Tax=Telopea speciosissima TaxID=54955 RepID=UPI001CC5D3BA|nr:chloride conductance regulatory protein ICln [Telopea speciosissima]